MTEERLARVLVELDAALAVLSDEFNAGLSGPSGLRAQAIAHVRQARILLRPMFTEVRTGVWMPADQWWTT
jgi:hypothetical protein